MKKLNISININNLNEFEARRLYCRLAGDENPLHPTAIKVLKEQIEKVLGYKPSENTI